nr:Flp family type IVb pilin [Hyphomonas sp. Mor2]
MHNFFTNESGATAIEYGLIAALIAVAIIGAVTALGDNVGATFDSISDDLTDATSDDSGNSGNSGNSGGGG